MDIKSEEAQKYMQKQFRIALSRIGCGSREDMELNYYFLNTENYSSSRITNPMTTEYLKVAKEGKLRDNLVRFWRFDRYMYACGRYYEIVGTAPQDGEHKDVLKVLKTAVSVLEEVVRERFDDEEE